MSLLFPAYSCDKCRSTFQVQALDTLPNYSILIRFRCPLCGHSNNPGALAGLLIVVAGIVITVAAVLFLLGMRLPIHKYVFGALAVVICIGVFRLLFGVFSLVRGSRE